MFIIYLFYLDTKASILRSSCYTHTLLLITLRAYYLKYPYSYGNKDTVLEFTVMQVTRESTNILRET